MVAQPDYTVDGTGTQGPDAYSLVASSYRKCLAPNAPGAIQANDVIIMLDEELHATLSPLVQAAQEEFWVQNIDQTIVANKYRYTIPSRASFANWRDVVYVDSNGVEINLTNLSPEYLKLTYPAGGTPPLYTFGFILQNDQIILWPPNGGVPTQYSLRMKIKRRPNNLTSVDNCAQVTGINTGTKVVTCTTVPSDWTTALTVDVIPNRPQFTALQEDGTITGVVTGAAGTVTFTALPTDPLGNYTMQVGDWICPATMSPIPQIPYDMFPLLAQRGALRILESLGDSQNLQVAERRYQDMAADFARTVSPRIEGTPKKIVNRNTPSYWGNYGGPFTR